MRWATANHRSRAASARGNLAIRPGARGGAGRGRHPPPLTAGGAAEGDRLAGGLSHDPGERCERADLDADGAGGDTLAGGQRRQGASARPAPVCRVAGDDRTRATAPARGMARRGPDLQARVGAGTGAPRPAGHRGVPSPCPTPTTSGSICMRARRGSSAPPRRRRRRGGICGSHRGRCLSGSYAGMSDGCAGRIARIGGRSSGRRIGRGKPWHGSTAARWDDRIQRLLRLPLPAKMHYLPGADLIRRPAGQLGPQME